MNRFKLLLDNIISLITKFIYFFNKRNENLWVFGEWFGERCCDNCFYFANYVSQNHPEINVVWISKAQANLSKLDSRIVKYVSDSAKAIDVLKHAGVVFWTHSYGDLSTKPSFYISGALMVNLWHGLPIKKIQLDMPSSAIHKMITRIRFALYGGKIYTVSSGVFSEIYHSAFACSKRNMIKTGSPRNTIFYNNSSISSSKNDLIKYINSSGRNLGKDTRIITYMPTFRDNNQYVFTFDELIDNEDLCHILEENNAVIVQKLHFITLHRGDTENKTSKYLVNLSDYNSQELLAASDILITDYSSCVFDFLMLNKPIIHFAYDYDYYSKNDRGVYFKMDDVACGDFVKTQKDLIKAINDNLINSQRNLELRKNRRDKYVEYETEDSCSVLFNNLKNRLD